MPREISEARSSTRVCEAQWSQQWSGASLGYPLKVVGSTLSDLGTPDAKEGNYPGSHGWYMAVLLDTPAGKWGIPQEPVYGGSRSADMAVLVTCAGILGVSDHMGRYVSLSDVSALT